MGKERPFLRPCDAPRVMSRLFCPLPPRPPRLILPMVSFQYLSGVLGCIGILFPSLCMGSSPAENQENTPPPNIVYIMFDDLGIDWIGCYGGQGETPNIDSLAAEGVRFETCWCAPICTVTRLELLTGQYPFRTGWINHHDVPRRGGLGFDPNRFTTFARLVRDAGYATVLGGKWQINDLRVSSDILDQHGFDEHCLWPGVESRNRPTQKRYWNGYLQTNGERAVHEYGPDAINSFLIDFIERHQDEPFMVYYPLMLPHEPILETPNTRGNAPRSKLERFADNVAYSDELVGRIVDTIDRLDLTDNTVIIFTCDNGSCTPGSVNGQPYLLGKGRVTNYGVHVPLVVRAPMLSEAGRVSPDLVDFTDMLPTLVELAGGAIPEGLPLDGQTFVGSIRGDRADEDQRDWIYSQRCNARIIRDQRYLLDYQGQFFDLTEDPLQEQDLSESNLPEVIEAKQRLTERLEAMPPDEAPPFPSDKFGLSIDEV